MFKKSKLNLTFSIIDQQWISPYRIQNFTIEEDAIEDLLSGKASFNFTIDLNNLIKNGIGAGPFKDKNKDLLY